MPLNILLYLLHRTDHSTKLRVCVNQQAVHIGPVTAAGCSGAAEAAAAPPSESQSCTRPIAAHRHQSHLPTSSVWRDLVTSPSHLHCSLQDQCLLALHPHTPPPQPLLRGQKCITKLWRPRIEKQWLYSEKHFRVCFLFLKSRVFAFT